MYGSQRVRVALAFVGAFAVAFTVVFVPLSLTSGQRNESFAAAAVVRHSVAESSSAAAEQCSRTTGPVDGVAPVDDGSVGTLSGEPVQRADGAIVGTSSADLMQFATRVNDLRVSACLEPLPAANFRFSSCLEDRLLWIAADPSSDPGSAWSTSGAVRSDGVPETGCTGSLAGGDGVTAAGAASIWWASPAHRLVLFRPDRDSAAGTCLDFAMVHGGIPNETAAFSRVAANRVAC